MRLQDNFFRINFGFPRLSFKFKLFKKLIFMKKIGISITLFICTGWFISLQSQDRSLHFISNSHLDTQWNWDVTTTIDQYVPNTLNQNISLLDKYPDFHFNFEGAVHYMFMKEYYPTQYSKLKQYVQNKRWNISGGSINASDVMIPSAESIIRNFLYGQLFYQEEFGQKGGCDIMLPDCFGFPYSLPTLAKHCGVTGFHTAKLAWGSAYNYDDLAPFGIWKGVDGSEIYALFKGEAYDKHEEYNHDMSNDSQMLDLAQSNQARYGVPFVFRYVGPRGDRGGALQDSTQAGENTPYWLQTSVGSNGPLKVHLSTPNQIFDLLHQYRNSQYFVWDNELPMRQHGVGCYTSQTIMKYWNRKNELLADATEKASVFADRLGGLTYSKKILRDSWVRLLWHQFHDDLTGTSIPNAYHFSYNDEGLINLDLSKTLTSAIGAVSKQLNTQVEGIPLVVYNPLSIQRTDLVEASVFVDANPTGIQVFDPDGKEVLSQITGYEPDRGKLSFIFESTVPSLGYATYDLRLNEKSSLTSGLKVGERTLENELYTVLINRNGDVASITDKSGNTELLSNPIRLAMFNDRSETFPSWEIRWEDVNSNPTAYVDENVTTAIAESGPLRISLKVTRSKNGSNFVQYIRLLPSNISERIDFVNEVNWQTRGTMLKAIFPLKANNEKATYDLSIGAIERGINTSNLYEVAGHQWADQTHTNGLYGVSILNDCKYGWDKPSTGTLRLTLIHTPAVNDNYIYQKDQDLGLNQFTYSFYRHLDVWNENTQWEASRLNQPMLAFQVPKHAGSLGKSVDFVSLNTNKVAIKALKKAENSDDEIIVRVYELTGNAQDNVKILFPANIVSAREANGLEETTGAANYSNGELTFSIGKFQPKTFAVKLESVAPSFASKKPGSLKVSLPYNIDVMSPDSKKNDATSGEKYAYPSELLSDTIVSDGIDFVIGNRTNGAKNAVFCSGQSIPLPAMQNAKKLYILAGSKNEDGSDARFYLNRTGVSFHIPYYSGNVAVWETEYNLGNEYRKENVVFTATHKHNVEDNKNEAYQFMYMYKYTIPLSGDETTLILPDNSDIYLFAVTLSDNENDDIIPASEITALPEFTEREANPDQCGRLLETKSVKASHQNNTNESASKAIDRNTNTKWCVTNNNTPWLELTFEKEVEICRWFVLNAGTESHNYITKDFRLQRLDSNMQWVNMDVVTNNTDNKINRPIEPFFAQRIRLQIDKGEQDGNTTRILEFAVFGQSDASLSFINAPEASETLFGIIENYPNPVRDKTIIRCKTPGNVTKLNLEIYDLSGRLLVTKNYPVTVNDNQCEIEWNRQLHDEGIYLYKVTAFNGDKRIASAFSKMLVMH
jgi:alpha-mannosidase